MNLQTLSHKMEWCKKKFPASFLYGLEKEFRSFLQIRCCVNELPQAAQPLLFLDLLYAHARNARWISAPIYMEFLVHFVRTEYRLPESKSIEIIHFLQNKVNNFLPPTSVQAENESFLRYLVVTLLTEAEPSLDIIGLGTTLILHIRQAFSLLEAQSSPTEKFYFTGTLNMELYAVWKEIIDTLQTHPLYLDELQLQQSLLDGKTSSTYSPAALLAVLTGIGQKKQAPQAYIQQQVEKYSICASEVPQLLDALTQGEWVYPLAGRGQQPNWALTEKGYQLTAPYYQKWLCKTWRTEFEGLHYLWQKQLVLALPVQAEASLFAYFSRVKPLHPCVLEAFMQRFTPHQAPKRLQEILMAYTQSRLPSPTRAAACSLLQRFLPAPEVLAHLSMMIDQEKSGLVLEAAFQAVQAVQAVQAMQGGGENTNYAAVPLS
jgi:hypothetical protein